MKAQRQIYILSGGAGTRLWPLSRETYPKQFYDLAATGRPLMIETAERLQSFGSLYILTTQGLKFPSMGLLSRFKIPATVVAEPLSRNTAAAVAYATWQSLKRNPEAVLGIFPADHLIENKKIFENSLQEAFDFASQGRLVTLGIHPSYPATAYGYMEMEANSTPGTSARKVKRFQEKPHQELAESLIQKGNAVWNAGIFIYKAQTMATLFRKHSPDLWNLIERIKEDESNLSEIYPQLPSISLDYALMEKAEEIFCIATPEMGWSDVGSWEEVAKRSPSLGKAIEISSQDNFYTGIIPEEKRVAFVGVKNLMVVDTPDALLIAQKGEGQKVREVVEQLRKEKAPQSHHHVFEDRPWGRFEILVDSPFFKSKRISMWPQQRLSYQNHSRRAEHWVIVKGEAQVTLEGQLHQLKAGDHIFIPLKAKHRIANPKDEVLEFIEVQTGTYFGEDDIERFEDDYGRT